MHGIIQISGDFNVTRHLVTSTPVRADDVTMLSERLAGLDGFVAVRVRAGARRLRVRYDASRTGFDAIADELKAAGYALAEDGCSRLRWMWCRFRDANVRRNAGTSNGACCSSPTDVYAGRHRKR